ncbi:hypothetical protein B0H12DRAFT_1192120 [Mycena haematopus]|nr:hypothetical protein B0H12DRAFT_1192120 [Mycena haematopus]
MASDFADTVIAADGTSSALGYVASALGATIQSQIGVDPINGAKVSSRSTAATCNLSFELDCRRNPQARCRVQYT